MLVTHWELSGPVVLRLSAWGARFLFSSGYKDIVIIWVQANFFVDFIPDLQFCMRKFEVSSFSSQASICGKLLLWCFCKILQTYITLY
ncbi:hypothetical protein GLYMA_13G065601v4 [Glycine max]|nr:hypothetical protein GLYMA_13G065601v4 [Glycine max]KAH1100145.1 hypothetical protein GYH30_035344 [Glycine max]